MCGNQSSFSICSADDTEGSHGVTKVVERGQMTPSSWPLPPTFATHPSCPVTLWSDQTAQWQRTAEKKGNPSFLPSKLLLLLNRESNNNIQLMCEILFAMGMTCTLRAGVMCQDQFTTTYNINVCCQEQRSMKALKQTDSAFINNIIPEIMEMYILYLFSIYILNVLVEYKNKGNLPYLQIHKVPTALDHWIMFLVLHD